MPAHEAQQLGGAESREGAAWWSWEQRQGRAEAGACAVRGLLQAAQNPRDAPATLPIAFTPPYIYMFIRFSSCFTHCGAIDRFLKSSSQSNNSWGDQRAMV